jgi:hypothetical protein
MKMNAVLIASSSADPIVEPYSDREDAERRTSSILTDAGWSLSTATAAAKDGQAAHLDATGDGDPVRILDLEVR